jgi:hypothetical protein
MTAGEIVLMLDLQPHPEGGYYREVYRSGVILEKNCLPDGFPGSRSASTSIYYLLGREDFSAFHRIRSDEIWHFYSGGDLVIHSLEPGGRYMRQVLGSHLSKGARFQVVVPAGAWFAAEPEAGTEYTLAGCTVAPGFDYEDFELARKEALAKEFPLHRELIQRLCRI